jgi:hypothetical protein
MSLGGDSKAADRDPGGDAARSLGPLVEQEARRILSEEQLAPDPSLVADGWERRFIADGRRAKEAVALYEELGFEVRAEPVRTDEMGDDCEDCQLLIALAFKTIYTRRLPKSD